MSILSRYGTFPGETFSGDLLPGRVTELRRELYTVITDLGEVTAELKGTFYLRATLREDFPCVGDFVLVQHNDSGHSRIAHLLPRRTRFARADFSGHLKGYAKTIVEQVVAANFDTVFIVTSLNRDFRVNRIARYLTQARQSGAQPVVILTKADLAEDPSEALRAVNDFAPGVPAHAISSHTGQGLEALQGYLAPGRTVVFLGMSGVGKSSLLNALIGQEVMAVNATRGVDGSKGRHTTTHRQLFLLPGGAMVIDTPGMRELGLIGAEEGIEATFADVAALTARCRFSDCHHQGEPGCAVRAALEDGSLPDTQWERYLAQKDENRYAEDRAGFLRDKRARGKDIAQKIREMPDKRGKF